MGYIPDQEAKSIERSGNLIDVSKINKIEWRLPDDKLDSLETLCIEVNWLHELCQTVSHTQLDMRAKNEKRGTAQEEHRCRIMRNDLFYNNLNWICPLSDALVSTNCLSWKYKTKFPIFLNLVFFKSRLLSIWWKLEPIVAL